MKERIMRNLLLTLILLLPISANSAVAQETRFISSPTLIVMEALPQQPTYQMLCRGGPGSFFKNIGSSRASSGETIVTYELVFTPSPQAAGSNGQGIEPLQCSWIDRPVNNREPYAIRFDTPSNAQLKQKLHGSAVDTSPTAAERYPDALTIPEYMKDKNRYWSFFVYNTGKGYLLATYSKHFKPRIRKEDQIRIPPTKPVKVPDLITTPKP